MNNILTTNNLCKSYGSLKVLNNISLEVAEGSIFGLLGPNGSGKTTTLSILLDIIPQDTGSFKWFDEKANHKQRQQIGSLLETPNFYGYLSAENNLKIAAQIKQIDDAEIDSVLKIVDLHSRKKDAFKTYSLGMKQRLAIASALLGHPKVLLLDEPTNGLDPQGIAEIRTLILDIAKKGITIIVASHILDEVEKICTHVAIIKKGNLLIQGKVNDILSNDLQVELQADNMQNLLEAIKSNAHFTEPKIVQDKYLVKLNSEISNANINEYFFSKGIILSHLKSKKKNLETTFLEITN